MERSIVLLKAKSHLTKKLSKKSVSKECRVIFFLCFLQASVLVVNVKSRRRVFEFYFWYCSASLLLFCMKRQVVFWFVLPLYKMNEK